MTSRTQADVDLPPGTRHTCSHDRGIATLTVSAAGFRKPMMRREKCVRATIGRVGVLTCRKITHQRMIRTVTLRWVKKVIAYESTTAALIVGGGITGSRGTFINLRTGTTGSFFSLGGGGGADIGIAEVAGTASSLALMNKGGASLSASAGIATFSANGSLGKGALLLPGKVLGLGLGLEP